MSAGNNGPRARGTVGERATARYPHLLRETQASCLELAAAAESLRLELEEALATGSAVNANPHERSIAAAVRSLEKRLGKIELSRELGVTYRPSRMLSGAPHNDR